MLFNKLMNSKWTSIDKYNGWYHYQVLNIFKKDKKVEMYPICKKFGEYKMNNKQKKWLSYL